MEFDLVQLIKDLGPSLGLLLYFVYKDYKFTGQIVALMSRVDAVLERFEVSGRKDGAA